MNNSTDNITDKATLEFMINPQYNNMNLAGNKDKENAQEIVQFKLDKRFYRKRIISLTRDMFKKNNLPENINELHNEYTKQIIEYLKLGDRKDILQEEYDNIEMNKDKDNNDKNDFDINNANKEIFHVKKNIPTLDNYVTIKKVDIEEKIIPKKKNVDLKHPKLRTKGINKKNKNKKNI